MHFHTFLHAVSHNFTQFWLFKPFLGQFQHFGYQNACTQAEKFNGDTFMHFQALPHAISRNFHSISCNFDYFSHFWANVNIFGTKKHIVQLRNSLCTPSCNFTQFSCNFTQFRLFQPFWGQFQHVGYQNACNWAENFKSDTFTHFYTLSHTFLAI